MPTVNWNLEFWGDTPWTDDGEIWSGAWGNSYRQWTWVLRPRIGQFLPAPVVLEIGPGYGRWTAYLKDLAERLIVVDLAPSCIDACKSRFVGATNIDYVVNDGRSLDSLADDLVDFAFSFDSLVHVEGDVLEAYISQLAHKLAPDGVAFLHHSNVASYPLNNYLANRLASLRRVSWLLNRSHIVEGNWHARGESVSAPLVREIAREAGLTVISQELINWGSKRLIDWHEGSTRLFDCMSMLTRPGSRYASSTFVIANRRLMAEARVIRHRPSTGASDRSYPDESRTRRAIKAVRAVRG